VKTLLIVLLLSAPLHALVVAPAGHSVHLARTEIVVVHTQDRQETLIRITPVFDGDAADRIGWIIPLPREPLAYGVSDADALYAGIELHSRLFGLAREQWANRTEYEWPEALTWLQKRDPPPKAPAGEPLPELELAAPFMFSLVESTALASWLADNGLAAPNPANSAESEGTYLCALITPREGRARLGNAIELSAARIRIAADAPYIPVITGQSNGRLDITIISDKPLDTEPYLHARDQLKADAAGYVLLLNLWSVQPLSDLLLPGADQPPRWYANRIESGGWQATEGDAMPELVLPLGDLKDELPGFWYYGDDEISFAEKFIREHMLAVTTSLFVFGVLFLIVKSRRRKSRVRGQA
jgi:hypothetical protein